MLPFRRARHVKHSFRLVQHNPHAPVMYDNTPWSGGPSFGKGPVHSVVRLPCGLLRGHRLFEGSKLQCTQLRIVIDQDRLSVAHIAFEDEPP